MPPAAAVVPGGSIPQTTPDDDEAGTVGDDDQWSSASEMRFRYGEYHHPGTTAPGDDWKSRWMRYDGDLR